ncbi:hypothetical protein CAEBREN_05556 [Caenorhabditis brenneri]|uniref:Uncharacterized protein n=1 Tax=Caenorhabditis brenneri TaxID=135651 RepID=G0PNJ7_CAEBE|nr:hypothetical protein CAEBREN_05556 [Caenorhabditis brenneri]
MWLGTYSLKEQLLPVIKSNFNQILLCHENNHGLLVENRVEDISGCARYRQNMESKADFDNGTLCLPISIGYDGFVPKGQMKKEITPIYVRIEALGEKENRTIKNVALAAVLVAKKGLTKENSNLAASRLHAEIISSQISPWRITIGNRKWAIKLVPCFLFADLKVICSDVTNNNLNPRAYEMWLQCQIGNR